MRVSTISANGDEDMARLNHAFTQVGVEGIVTVEPSTDGEDTLTIVDGYECEKGYISPILLKFWALKPCNGKCFSFGIKCKYPKF